MSRVWSRGRRISRMKVNGTEDPHDNANRNRRRGKRDGAGGRKVMRMDETLKVAENQKINIFNCEGKLSVTTRENFRDEQLWLLSKKQ